MKLTKEQTENVIACLSAGYIGFVGEWRGAKVEVIRWTEKPDRPAGEMAFASHVVEVGEGANFKSLVVRVRIEDVATADSVKFDGFQKGMPVFVRLNTYFTEKGRVTVEADELVSL